jgi:ribonucleoside-diphosphate reductase alpha chain
MKEVAVEATTPSDSASGAGISVVEKSRNEEPSATQSPEQRDLFARARRRKLPDERKSITHKFSVGGHEDYIIVGMYSEGRPGEIFIKMAKEGSTLSGFMDGVALSISIGLQYGVPLKTLVSKLTNTRLRAFGIHGESSIRYASSILDYIARWLGGKFLSPEYFKPRVASNDQEPNQAAPGSSSATPKADDSSHPGNRSATLADAPSCPTCGMLMVPNGSCYKCVNCGNTSGCS